MGTHQVRAPAAWDITTGSASVVVAVVDTDQCRPPRPGRQVLPGYDFASDDNDPSDDHGHGTHVAGIIGARSNNSLGVAGMSWMPRHAGEVCLYGTLCPYDDIVQGIVCAVDNGADVINMSLAGTEFSQALQDAINYAHGEGVFVVAAAGNGGRFGNPVTYPASMEHVVAVSATMQADDIFPHSSYGPYVDVSAPGFDIFSTYYWPDDDINGYYSLSGTSMAAPHVSGIAALMLSVAPGLSPDQAEDLVETTAVDLGDPGRDDYYGWGRVDALAAVQAASPAPTPTPTPTPTLTPVPTETRTPTPTATPTGTPRSTPTPTATATATATPTPTATGTPPSTPTLTPTPVPLVNETFAGSVGTRGNQSPSRDHVITVATRGTISAQLAWKGNGNLRLEVHDPMATWRHRCRRFSPSLDYAASGQAGTLRVVAVSGGSNHTLDVRHP
jgi:subtilisin family serine protease